MRVGVVGEAVVAGLLDPLGIAPSDDAMVQLYYQNPRFGMFMVRIIVRRLLKNWQDADACDVAP